MLDRFDHVVLGVADIAEATRAFQRAGFDVLDRKDPPGASEGRFVRFRDGSSIELLTFHSPSPHRFQTRFASGPGWIDYAVNAKDLAPAEKALAEISSAAPFRRTVGKKMADGNEWGLELSEPSVSLGEPVLPFLTRDLTPPHWRVAALPSNVEQPSGIFGIAGVTVVTPQFAASEPSMRALFGTPQEISSRYGAGTTSLLFRFGENWVELVEARDSQTEIGKHLGRRGAGLYDVSLRGADQPQPLEVGALFGACLRVESGRH